MRTALQLADTVDNEIVNLGSGTEYSIRDFAALICAEAGYDPAAIQYDTSKYVGARSKCLSIEKLRRLLPEFSPMPLAQGLPPVITWVRDTLLKKSA